MNNYLDLEGKNVLVAGIANRKSVAYHVATQLRDLGARVLCSVRTEQRTRAPKSRSCVATWYATLLRLAMPATRTFLPSRSR